MEYKWNFILEIVPEEFKSILADNGHRYAVIYRRKDKYFVEQDNYEFFPQYWCELPSLIDK